MGELDQNGERQHAEFDSFAAGYSGGMDNPIKALAGASADDFLSVKYRWLMKQRRGEPDWPAEFRILDYGCGRGDLLNLMARRGMRVDMVGSDVSGEMLKAGQQIWPRQTAPLPRFLQQDGVRVPLAGNSVDLAIVSSVLHHVPVDQRDSVFAELFRLLKPGGQLVVFEHNPLNPVTRYVVAHTPIDENAILLRASEVLDRAKKAGFVETHSE